MTRPMQTAGMAAADRPAVAWAPLSILAIGVAGILIALAGRYGYHRDELYFLRAGREAAFGYVDQPPLTPLLAAGMDWLLPASLVGLRLPSALAAGAVVVLTGLIAREFGGGRSAQLLAAAAMAVSAFLLAVGHLFSTSTLDLLAWTTLSWLLVRALRDGGVTWLVAGAVAGVALQNKVLPAFLIAVVLVCVLAVGPRQILWSRWPLLGGLLAMVIWAPNLVWQAANGFPQLELSRAIASGSSGTSEPWYLFLPFQLVLVSPLLVPIWAVGWWRLARDPALRTWRAFAVAYALLAVVFMLTGGKPYYVAGLYPLLLAAGGGPVTDWVRRGAGRARAVAVVAALVLSLTIDAVLMLPIVPERALASTPIIDLNYDAGETIGWPMLAATVEKVAAGLPAGDVVVLTRNYGQAGAIDRFAPELGPAYSGHNSYWTWGPPADSVTAAVVVGFDRDWLHQWFDEVELATRFDNGVDLGNDEQGVPIWIVSGRSAPWSQIWPAVRLLA